MRVVIPNEAYYLIVDGLAYSSHLTHESFWSRYLDVFDSVLVVGRGAEVDRVPAGYHPVTQKGVEFAALPSYHGPYEFLKNWSNIRSAIRGSLRKDDAFILLVPGYVSIEVLKCLPARYPYGVEMKGDPWLSLAPGSVRSLGRPFFRVYTTMHIKSQCRHAVAISYVTEHVLQRRYPPNPRAFTTNYSSVNLKQSDLCANIDSRIESIIQIPKRLKGEDPPVCLGFVGSFSQYHKLPHIHLKAFARCISSGANLTMEMIGDGKMLPQMKRLAEELGIAERVFFRGRISGGKPIFDAMDKFDLFLNATAVEGLPRVVIEAMSRGCPCIASDVGGTLELLEQNYLVPHGDFHKLSEVILRVLSDTTSLVKTTRRNVSVARNYCEDILRPRRHTFYQVVRQQTEKHLRERS